MNASTFAQIKPLKQLKILVIFVEYLCSFSKVLSKKNGFYRNKRKTDKLNDDNYDTYNIVYVKNNFIF